MSGSAAPAPAALRRPLVGAVRWDAWVGDLPTYNSAGPTAVGLQVERVLGRPTGTSRLPFYAREVGDHQVEIRGASQDVVDREIEFAAGAGLDYWAFVYYPPGSGLDAARRFYLASAHRSRIAFCLIFDSLSRFRSALRDFGELLDAFARPEHVRSSVRGWPVFFMPRPARTPADVDVPALRLEIEAVRAAAVAARVGDPYIAVMGGAPPLVRWAVDALGLDAGSRVRRGRRGGAPFADLVRAAEGRRDAFRAVGLRVLPWVTSGWDPRPRVEHPVSWTTCDPDGWVQAGTPAETRRT